MSMIGFRSWDDDAHDDDGSMFGPKIGTWSMTSQSDPLFNQDGRAYGFPMDAPADRSRDLNRPIPTDLVISFFKD